MHAALRGSLLQSCLQHILIPDLGITMWALTEMGTVVVLYEDRGDVLRHTSHVGRSALVCSCIRLIVCVVDDKGAIVICNNGGEISRGYRNSSDSLCCGRQGCGCYLS